MILLLFKLRCHILQQISDRQMLRTDLLTFSAFDTSRGLTVIYCMYTVVIEVQALFLVQIIELDFSPFYRILSTASPITREIRIT